MARQAAANTNKVQQPPASDIRAYLDRMDEGVIGGWAVDLAEPFLPLQLRISIDGVIVDSITCDLRREDAPKLKLPSEYVGFSYFIPARYLDGGRHVLTLSSIAGTPVTMFMRNGMAMLELHFCIGSQTVVEGVVEGVVDGVVDGLIQGWAVNIDKRTNTAAGGVRILVTAAGQPVAELMADQFRADVKNTIGVDAACGFNFSPPPDLRDGKRITLRFYAMPGRIELRGSPIETVFPDDDQRRRIKTLIARADELFGFAYHLRKELLAALPGERYMLSDYTRWAGKSMPLALPRAIARYGALPADMPLVSIICPVYRPALGDFLTAVESVRAQSYQNWELLLVDDGSGEPALTAAMNELKKVDARIKVKVLAKNGGISRASNAAMKNASGRFIAFFDHDDVLAPHAVEIMLRAQAATGAKLLYSDEDKIDRSGAISEPHLKPDFNYRFLLELNYICHFVLVEAAALRQAGILDPRFDGAQDHDLLLRLSERLTPQQFHHVPEILYHWRKSAGSTAASGAAKPGAAGAGELAVREHLGRRKLNADVVRRGDLTCYKVMWKPAASVKKAAKVSILIPFKDHIELTQACVAAIRANTKDVTYEIILLDNWSTAPEAEKFCAAQANMPDTRVIRITESFNFSRINNIGARAAKHDYLLFLNNDVFVRQPDWLRIMIDEMLMNEKIGAVGAKLLYPNGTVQHGGVVLGVGGIADHIARGLPGDAPGYVMRGLAVQQISALTAACMLVRKTAFQGVGGFDEVDLTVAFNDVDLCIKMAAAGWQMIYMPDAVAEHRESISRGGDLEETKIARFMLESEVMRQRHADILPYDPFYNPHFSREGGVYRELRLLQPDAALLAPSEPAGG